MIILEAGVTIAPRTAPPTGSERVLNILPNWLIPLQRARLWKRLLRLRRRRHTQLLLFACYWPERKDFETKRFQLIYLECFYLESQNVLT
jgi:hypothetical protein